MNILVRLPNWLGDMVMSVGMMNQLPLLFPGSRVSVIAKRGIHELLGFFPPTEDHFIFSKDSYKGIRGLIRFGREIKNTQSYDLFICLPDSLSAAVMGAATGARERIGYKKELRNVLLTHSYKKPSGGHRVEEYTHLLERFTGKKLSPVSVKLNHHFPKEDYIVVNINSEASSRRLTVAKGVEVLKEVLQTTDRKLVLVGAPKEKPFVDSVLAQTGEKDRIENRAGTTSLSQLVQVLASARCMLTTDSGPAHLANALGTHTVVLFGAGNEKNTAPYNKDLRSIIRLGELSCEPCEKNVCIRYGTPLCLENLDSRKIASQLKLHSA